MSLSLEKLGKTSIPIVGVYTKKDALDSLIYYTDNEDLAEGYKELKKIRLNDKDKEFFPEINDFQKTQQVQHIMVSGSTGCGKTYWICQYAQHFKKKYPKCKILLFSSKVEDDVIDKLKYIERVEIDEDMLINPYTLNEIASPNKYPVLTIFDDIQDFPTKKLNVEIARLRDEVMRNGRSSGIYSIYVNHDPCNYKETKSQIFEANMIVIFPKKCGLGTYDYLMDKKLHLGKKIIDAVNSLKSSYVCINKSVPSFITSNKYIIVL